MDGALRRLGLLHPRTLRAPVRSFVAGRWEPWPRNRVIRARVPSFVTPQPLTLPRLRPATLRVGALVLTAIAGSPTGASSQSPTGTWNGSEVLELVRRARTLRNSTAVDPEFRSYTSDARGYVYFFVDRPDATENVLVKVDQIALDLYFVAPNTTRQRIVGLRDQQVLPTSIRYHLDHLTVVQDDFGDFIRLGDGDEVEAVAHPLGPLGEEVYDYQLSDSLRISYASGQEEIRVYEVRVRPKRMEAPGFVGTVLLDRDRAAVVRMNFSFTPVSYVDPYLDYIRIATNNSLWLGQWWLPYRQEIEIRRETPFFDFMAGSTIRTTFDVRGYDFNVEVPERVLRGPPVGAVSPAQRSAFPFERSLFADLEGQGDLTVSPALEEVEREVREVAEQDVLSGLTPLRLHLARVSDFARYNRAEGIFTGAGLSWRPTGDVLVRATGGYAFGRDRGSGALTVQTEASGVQPTIDVFWDRMGDIGGHPGATPLENTISAAAGEKDYLDPFFRRGASLTLQRRPEGRTSVTARWEEHVDARDVVSGSDSEFRPVRSIDDGTVASLTVSSRFTLPASGVADVSATAGRLEGRTFASLDGTLAWAVSDLDQRWSARASLNGGVTHADAPAQTLFLLGGRQTLLGHDYRSFAGNAYWLGRLEGTVPVRPPFLGLRAFAAVGSTYLSDPSALPADWAARDSDGLRGSVGLGLSIGWDSTYLDVGRAVWGSGWEMMLSVAPHFRSWL
jgi:hypothetical protein